MRTKDYKAAAEALDKFSRAVRKFTNRQTMKDAINEKGELELKDSWQNSKHLTLSIPRKDSGSYSIYQLPHQLALDALIAHIDKNKKELERLKGICEIQLA